MDSLVIMANKLLDNFTSGNERTTTGDPAQGQDESSVDAGNGNPAVTRGHCSCSPHYQSSATFNDLPDVTLNRIFSYLNPSDLLHSRFVSRKWSNVICKTDHFLKSWTLQLDAQNQVFLTLSKTLVTWENISILYLDVQRQAEDLYWEGLRKFIMELKDPPSRLKFLEFRCCALSWPHVKRIVSWVKNLEHLSFTRCIFIQEPFLSDILRLDDDNELIESEYLSIMKNLKFLTLEDVTTIDKITGILIYMVSLSMSNLERLEILFDSNDESPSVTEESAQLFHFQILQVIYLNRKSLKGLFLNLRDDVLVSTFCSQVLDNFHSTIKTLEEFQLTPFVLGHEFGIDIATETHAPMLSLVNFFNRHQNLKNVSFPHFNNRLSTDVRRRRIVRSLPKSLEKLHLPGYSYLVANFLSHLPNLKYIFMGSAPLGGRFHPNAYRYTPQVCQKVEAMGMNSRIHLSPGKLNNFSWKFPALTRLDFDALRSVINDRDVQGIIHNCRWLRHLCIYGCDMISDFGVTGCSAEFCREIFRLGIIYSNPPEKLPVIGKYKPLSSLKGLRTLLLRGNTQITDVGIYYGFRFQEVQSLWVPYNERITSWGIRKLGQANPSLENFGMTKANPESSAAIQELTVQHPRMSSDRVVVQTMSENESVSMMARPTMLTAIIMNGND